MPGCCAVYFAYLKNLKNYQSEWLRLNFEVQIHIYYKYLDILYLFILKLVFHVIPRAGTNRRLNVILSKTTRGGCTPSRLKVMNCEKQVCHGKGCKHVATDSDTYLRTNAGHKMSCIWLATCYWTTYFNVWKISTPETWIPKMLYVQRMLSVATLKTILCPNLLIMFLCPPRVVSFFTFGPVCMDCFEIRWEKTFPWV